MTIKLADLAHKIEAMFLGAAPVAGAVAAASAGTALGAIANVILAIPQFIDLAEELIDAPGSVKLAAVKASVQAGITEVDPTFAEKLHGPMALITPLISMLVTAKKFGLKI